MKDNALVKLIRAIMPEVFLDNKKEEPELTSWNNLTFAGKVVFILSTLFLAIPLVWFLFVRRELWRLVHIIIRPSVLLVLMLLTAATFVYMMDSNRPWSVSIGVTGVSLCFVAFMLRVDYLRNK